MLELAGVPGRAFARLGANCWTYSTAVRSGKIVLKREYFLWPLTRTYPLTTPVAEVPKLKAGT
jgi:hypothetical protein